MTLLIALAMTSALQAPVGQEVTFKGAGGLELHGTLTLPTVAEGTKVPAVVLLPGSGPTDRDGNQLPSIKTDILKQISDTLVGAGIATLRFDKRSAPIYRPLFVKLKLEELQSFFSWDNFVEDATDAYKFLYSQSGVDSSRVAMLGHSEGAIISLQVGSNMSDDPDRPAALVIIGGTGRPMGPVIREQVSRGIAKMEAPLRKQYMDYTDAAIAQISKDGTLPATTAPPGMAALFNVTTEKLLQSYFTTDPAKLAAKCKGPVLVINGANDSQVSAERDTPKLEQALKGRPSGAVKVLIVPKGSHNLKETTPQNQDVFTGPVIPVALTTIRLFLTKELHVPLGNGERRSSQE